MTSNGASVAQYRGWPSGYTAGERCTAGSIMRWVNLWRVVLDAVFSSKRLNSEHSKACVASLAGGTITVGMRGQDRMARVRRVHLQTAVS